MTLRLRLLHDRSEGINEPVFRPQPVQLAEGTRSRWLESGRDGGHGFPGDFSVASCPHCMLLGRCRHPLSLIDTLHFDGHFLNFSSVRVVTRRLLFSIQIEHLGLHGDLGLAIRRRPLLLLLVVVVDRLFQRYRRLFLLDSFQDFTCGFCSTHVDTARD